MAEPAAITGPRIGETVAAAARALADASDSPRLDAELLLADVLGTERTRLILDSRAVIDGEAHERFERLVHRRCTGEPVAYLLGRRAFRTLDLAVDRRVLIPRPETEELVQAALDELPVGASVLDVGTGSGAIALALSVERPDLRVRGVDCSPDAVAVARANASALGLDLSFSVSDLLEGCAPVDAVLANLPYVETGARLPVDVAAFEPGLALYGGPDGLALIRRLAAQLADRRWPAWVMLEIGEAQGQAVTTLLRTAGFGDVEVRVDLARRDRIVIGRRPSGERPRR